MSIKRSENYGVDVIMALTGTQVIRKDKNEGFRNMIRILFICHGSIHNGRRILDLSVLAGFGERVYQ